MKNNDRKKIAVEQRVNIIKTPSYNDDVATLFRFNLTSLINYRTIAQDDWVIYE
jgi:hypothetical protein